VGVPLSCYTRIAMPQVCATADESKHYQRQHMNRKLEPMEESSSNVAVARAAIYSLLGSLYLDIPNLGSFEKSLEELGNLMESKSIRILTDFFQNNRRKSLEEVQETVSVEYSRLFLGINPERSLPPPYESVWMGEGMVMGASTARVLEAYSEAGVELAPDIKELPDHIGIELGFLSYLCNQEANARKRDDTDARIRFLCLQDKFLHDHAERWMPRFCLKLEESDRTGFYSGIATMTEEFLKAERVELSAELS
jgi:TorA maturation chaperone TorD